MHREEGAISLACMHSGGWACETCETPERFQPVLDVNPFAEQSKTFPQKRGASTRSSIPWLGATRVFLLGTYRLFFSSKM